MSLKKYKFRSDITYEKIVNNIKQKGIKIKWF